MQEKVDNLKREVNALKGEFSEAKQLFSMVKRRGLIQPYELIEKYHEIKSDFEWFRSNIWSVMENDPQAYNAFITKLRTEIAHEVNEAGLFIAYEENPQAVINIVKEHVEEKLRQWEFDDQVTIQLVDKVFNQHSYFNKVMDRMYGIITTKEFAEKLAEHMAGEVAEYLIQNHLTEIINSVVEETVKSDEFINLVADKVKNTVLEEEESSKRDKVNELLKEKPHICMEVSK